MAIKIAGNRVLDYDVLSYSNTNIAVGYQTLQSLTTGTNNSAVGNSALYDLTTATNNTVIGYNTGRGITTGSKNTIIGANVTGLSATLANTIILADGDGNKRIYVDSSGNVGIGTSSPTNVLDVVSTTQPSIMASTYISGSAAVAGYFAQAARGTVSSPTATQSGDRTVCLIGRSYGGTTWVNHGAINLYCAENQSESARGSYLTFDTTATGATGRSERMRIDSSGNVGIGTSTPSGARLQVYSLAGGTGAAINLQNLGSGDTALSINNSGGTNRFNIRLFSTETVTGLYGNNADVWIGSNTNGTIPTKAYAYFNNTTENVGIGTTSPFSKTTISKAVTNTVTTLDSTNAAHLTLAGTDALVRLQFGCGGASLGSYGAFIQAYYDNTTTSGGNGIEALLLNPIGGNVGIGTTSLPASKLTIYDSNKVIDSIGNFSVFTTNSQAADLGGSIGLGGANGSAGAFDPWAFAAIKGAKENSTSSNFAGYLAFATASSGGTIAERMRIDSSGKLLIGTTTASTNSLLTIVGGGIKIGNTNNTDATLHISTSYGGFDRLTQIHPTGASKPALNLMASNDASSNNQWWVWGIDANVWKIHSGTSFSATPTFSITSGGNVGIGTPSPSAKLDIGSGNLNFSSTGQRITGDFSNATLSSRVLFQTSTANSSSVVGVITSGTGTISQLVAYGGSDPSNAQALRVDMRGGSEARIESTYAGTPSSGTYLPLTFFTGGSERMRIDSSGNVGIGTTVPYNRLTIASDSGTNGASFFHGTYVAAQTWGTRLFKNDIGGGIPLQIETQSSSTWYTSIRISHGQSSSHPSLRSYYETQLATDGGNVGIGTTSPGKKLDIISGAEAGLRIAASATSGYAYIQLGQSATAANNWHFGSENDGSLRFYNGNWGSGTFRAYLNNLNNGTFHINDVAIGRGGGGILDNMAVGYLALNSNTTNGAITALGPYALQYNTGYDNTAVGYVSLRNNTTGVVNTAVGAYALNTNTVGDGDTAVGQAALQYNTTGYHNTAVGTSALRSNTTGVLNTAVGWCALQNNTTGVYNTAMGRYSLQGNTTGAGNSAFGMHTLLYTSTGGYNTAMGESALATNTTGNNNTGLGYYALVNNTTGYDNTAVGSAALQNNTTGRNNVAVGRLALLLNTTGIENTAVGALSLYFNSTGYSNSAMGYVALYNNTTGYANNAFGYGAMYVNTTGYYNTSMGHEALRGNTTGYGNSAFGFRAMYSHTTGYYNTAVGYESLYYNTTGYQNSAFGFAALLSNTTGYNNTAVGYNSLRDVTTGIQNTAIGYNTGRGITTGSKNTIIGANVTGLSATLANNIIIADGDGNRRINVDSSGYVLINTNTTPSATGGNTPRLTVVGSQRTVFLHGENALFLLPAGNNGAANGDAGLYVWISEPAQTWTGAGIARNMYNTTAFPRVNSSLSGQMIRFDEGTIIQFTVETSGGARSVPLTVGHGGTEVLAGNATDNGAYNLQCNGTAVWGAGAYVNGSDFRLKTNIKSLDSGLDVIKAVRPVTFQYKPEYNKDENIQTGFIAQELLEALKDKEYVDGIVQKGYEYLSVAYQNFIPILVKAIQELTTRVEELENK